MSDRLIRHVRANLVAYVALFVALGGTSVAAVEALPRNSVGSPQIKNRSIQTVDVSRRAVSALRGQRGLRGAQGLPGAKGDKGDTGDKGDKGDKGDAGAPGLSDYERVQAVANVNPGDTSVVLAASCPAGKKIVGGGGLVQDSKLHITFSFPQVNDVWGFTAVLLPGQTITSTSQAFAIAICAKVG